ncbi:MAG: zinc ribbon domain-containing protein, partial [Gemmatimonadota bacterium]
MISSPSNSATPPAPCPACGFANPPGNRFCGGCGAPLETSAATSAEERR